MSLEGVRVLELTHYIAGPYCGQVLADMGAEVIKIEKPGEGNGDIGRNFEPKYNDISLYFATFNRNKRFVTLDIKTEKGKDLFRRLVESADAVVENYRPGVLEKLGFGYEDLKKINPRIVMTSVSGYGQTGPYRNRQGIDMAIQAESGFMDMTGFPDGPPVKAGPVLSDIIGALYSAIGTLTALYHQKSTGQGQQVDVALLDATFTLLENFPAIYHITGKIPPRAGNARPFSAQSGAYKAKDGRYLNISCTSNPLYSRLMNTIGHPELTAEADERYSNSSKRKVNEAAIEEAINQWIKDKTVQEAAAILEAGSVPHGKVNSVAQIIQDDQIKAREMLITMKDSVLEDLPLIGSPIKLSKTKVNYRFPPAFQGQDNEEIYGRILKLTKDQLSALQRENVI